MGAEVFTNNPRGLDYSGVERIVAARCGSGSCIVILRTDHSEADAVLSARPKGKRCREYNNECFLDRVVGSFYE